MLIYIITSSYCVKISQKKRTNNVISMSKVIRRPSFEINLDSNVNAIYNETNRKPNRIK